MLDLAKRFANRPGGYTRIVKFGPRRGDGAPISIIEFLPANADADASDGEGEAKPKKKAAKKAAAKTAE